MGWSETGGDEEGFMMIAIRIRRAVVDKSKMRRDMKKKRRGFTGSSSHSRDVHMLEHFRKVEKVRVEATVDSEGIDLVHSLKLANS